MNDCITSSQKLSKKIFITGMHRSGTSLVAMWLNRCGIQFEVEHLTGPAKFNKKGHFEDKRVVALHDLAINSYVAKSKGWVVTKPQEFIFNDEHEDMARKIIMSYEKSFDVWGWKDPRSALFLHSWKNLIPDLKVVMVWRSADAVVDSLMRRSTGATHQLTKLSLLEAIQCWKIYNQKILEFRNSFPGDTILVRLDRFLSHDSQVIDLINSKLNVRLEPVPIAELYQKELLQSGKSNYLYWYPGIKTLTNRLEDNSAHFEC